MAYFKNITTLEQLRKQYRDLLKIHHPDNGGNVSQMQEINAEYDKLFKILKDKHDSNTTGNNNSDSNAKADYNSMKYDFSEDVKLREMLSKIISFDGITIEVCGNWIWAFDSYTYHKELKGLGFKYARNKRAWYWHSDAFRKRSHKSLSMDDIRGYYGSTEVETGGMKRLRQA